MLQPLRWRCIDCVIHHKWDVHEEQQYICLALCCHGAKLCSHAARDFWSPQNGAVTRMWRSCRIQPSHKECAIGVVCCKKEEMFLQPLRWRCVDCVIHHEWDMRKEQQYIQYAWRKQAIIREIATHDLNCYFLPQCKALRTCCSGFLIATICTMCLYGLLKQDAL